VADVHRFLEIEMRGDCRQIVGIVIHVVAVTGLGRTAMSAPVVGYDAIAVVEEETSSACPNHQRIRGQP